MALEPSRDLFRLANSADVHLWFASVSELRGEREVFDALLSGGERSRAERFVRDEDRERYTIAHGLLREILQNYVAVPAAKLEFLDNGFGKPALRRCDLGKSVSFNLSHSGDALLIGVTDTARIGVDVEAVRRDVNVVELASGHFSSEEARRLETLRGEERLGAFFRCWTRKEAYVKARGEGLSFPLDGFTVGFLQHEPACLHSVDGEVDAGVRWTMEDVRTFPGYAGAAVVELAHAEFSHRRWTRAARRKA